MSHDPPGWTRPERLPDDLPPHERWVEQPWEVWGAPAKHPPQTAPGFTRAQQRGLLPAPASPYPPRPLPGPTAGLLGAAGLGLFFSSAPLILVMQQATWWLLAYGLASWFGGLRLLRAYQRREEVEAAAGYTTTWGAPGLWRLTPLGRVARPPDPTVLPNGFYPSPYWPGVLQKWEGTHWKPFPRRWWRHPEHWFRTPDVPYL